MDRGIVEQELQHNTANIQVCRYGLGDPDSRTIFITACDTGICANSPVNIDGLGRAWPECVTVSELDALISALQDQRDWLAENGS